MNFQLSKKPLQTAAPAYITIIKIQQGYQESTISLGMSLHAVIWIVANIIYFYHIKYCDVSILRILQKSHDKPRIRI